MCYCYIVYCYICYKPNICYVLLYNQLSFKKQKRKKRYFLIFIHTFTISTFSFLLSFSICCYFPSARRTSSILYCNVGLPVTHFLSFYLVKNFSKLPPFPFAFVVLSDFSLSVLPHCSIRRVRLCLFLPSHVSLWDVPCLLVSPCPSPGQVGTLLSLDWQPRLSFGL